MWVSCPPPIACVQQLSVINLVDIITYINNKLKGQIMWPLRVVLHCIFGSHELLINVINYDHIHIDIYYELLIIEPGFPVSQ